MQILPGGHNMRSGGNEEPCPPFHFDTKTSIHLSQILTLYGSLTQPEGNLDGSSISLMGLRPNRKSYNGIPHICSITHCPHVYESCWCVNVQHGWDQKFSFSFWKSVNLKLSCVLECHEIHSVFRREIHHFERY